MQIVIAWIVGSPLVAVLVGKMISLADRQQPAVPTSVRAEAPAWLDTPAPLTPAA